MDITLTNQEKEVLTEMLTNQHRSLEQQIFRTDRSSARAMLREREHILQSVLEKLGIANLS
jgi:vacuolar-type H+-ATPase subunit E/Vma4